MPLFFCGAASMFRVLLHGLDYYKNLPISQLVNGTQRADGGFSLTARNAGLFFTPVVVQRPSIVVGLIIQPEDGKHPPPVTGTSDREYTPPRPDLQGHGTPHHVIVVTVSTVCATLLLRGTIL